LSAGEICGKQWGCAVEQAMIDAFLIIFGVIALAIGVAVYVVQFRQGLRADASKKWPTSRGTIVSSALEQTPENKRRYRAAVQYRYRAGGKNYESNRIFWGGNEGRQKHMTSVVASYPAGGEVRVHYDPQNPAEAVLDPTQNTGSRPLVVYAMGMISIGVFAFGGGLYALLH
jgi:Protein of unknown function (DUF3592)